MVCNSLYILYLVPTYYIALKKDPIFFIYDSIVVVHTKVVEKALLSLLVISYESLQKMPLCCKSFIAADALQKHRFSP